MILGFLNCCTVFHLESLVMAGNESYMSVWYRFVLIFSVMEFKDSYDFSDIYWFYGPTASL